MGIRSIIKSRMRRSGFFNWFRQRRQCADFAKLRSQFWKCSSEDEKRRAFYRDFISEGQVVFDIGANLGNRAKTFAMLGATVICVEPQPACAQFLRSVFADAHFDCRVVESAVGATSSIGRLKVCDAHTLSSMSSDWIEAVTSSGRFESFFRWDKEISVQITTLDDLISEFGHPNFVKIDVEGYEDRVIQGLTSHVPALSFEYTPEYSIGAGTCIARLSALHPQTRFQLSLGESLELNRTAWTTGVEIMDALPTHAGGDIYAVAPSVLT